MFIMSNIIWCGLEFTIVFFFSLSPIGLDRFQTDLFIVRFP